MLQCPKLPMFWLHIEHPHTGLTGSWLIHKRYASQRVGLVATSPTLRKQWRRSPRTMSKTKRPCKTTAACFTLPTTPRRRFVLDGTTRAIVVSKVMTNCATGTPILHAEASFNSAERGLRRGSRAEPLSNVAFILASFQSLQFSFANNSKGLWLLA